MTTNAMQKSGRRDLREVLLEPDMKRVFAAMVPRHMTPERMLRLSIACITRTPKIAEVSQVEVVGALVQCAALGLEPNTALQHIHLIPFENRKRGRMELQTIIGYRGFLDLGRRSGQQVWIHGDVVRPGDEFSYAYGNDAHLRHKPGRSATREAPTEAYCFVKLKDGGFAFTVLPEWEILQHREASFAWRRDGERSPWGQYADRMWRKTAIRALYSGGEVPLDTELAMAVATDEHRMDYAAMGDAALRGGAQAIEQIREGMDSFVTDDPDTEAEPEQPQRREAPRPVDIREVARPAAQPAQEQPPLMLFGRSYVRLGSALNAIESALESMTGEQLRHHAQEIVEALELAGREGREVQDLREGLTRRLTEAGPAPRPQAAEPEPQAEAEVPDHAADDEAQARYERWVNDVRSEAAAATTPAHMNLYRRRRLLEAQQYAGGQRDPLGEVEAAWNEAERRINARAAAARGMG
jgi:recombination protein RecT